MTDSITINTTFLLRRGKQDTWTEKNPILQYGEPGFEKETGKIKIGLNNSSHWNDLPYLFSNPVVEDNSALIITKDQKHDSIIALKGYAEAEVNSIPIKSETGLNWTPIANISTSNSTSTIYEILAGANNTYKGEADIVTNNNGIITLMAKDNNGDYQTVEPILNTVYSYEGNIYKTIQTIVNEEPVLTWIDATPVTKTDFTNLSNQVQTLIASANQGGALIVATNEILGAVKSSDEINTISVNENTGIMTVNEISIDKITQNGIKLILDGGDSEMKEDNVENS